MPEPYAVFLLSLGEVEQLATALSGNEPELAADVAEQFLEVLAPDDDARPLLSATQMLELDEHINATYGAASDRGPTTTALHRAELVEVIAWTLAGGQAGDSIADAEAARAEAVLDAIAPLIASHARDLQLSVAQIRAAEGEPS